MATMSEICKDGLKLRIIREEDEKVHLQIVEEDAPPESREGLLPIDADVLCAVLRGMTYQVASEKAYCTVRRSGGKVIIEFESGGKKHRCEMTAEEFSRLVAPIMPARLRAMLL